ncbi:hypothetical protein GALMADRAFT_91393 [Galerina marginata CBS 339.88]|uniref:Malate dehydrogenase n=1 Tax=Galerina marginata (strain CBS 339.88) TaxID=685588 RepID=A0A067TLH4_GALM3|nr:hypothetical protein GALMADRAFT_91393 [Galerina marginata CBS 339.88]
MSFFVTLALAASAIAAPGFQGFPAPPAGLSIPGPGAHTCSVSSAKLVLPAGQTALTAPTDPTSFVLLGVGYQNYTCSAAGAYASAGAVADLFDLSCLSKIAPIFNNIQDAAFAAWKVAPPSFKIGPSTMGYPLLGNHFFQPSPSGTGLSPVWDFRAGASKGNPDAFVLAARVANLPAPSGPTDVDWLQLKSVSGSLATQVYRTDTRGGVPPASCTPGSAPISLKYVSKYWLFGGSVKV